MGYKDDQIKILQLVCSHMLPTNFNEENQEIKLYEDDFKAEGFSYSEAIVLLKEMYDVMKKFDNITAPDGRRGVSISTGTEIESFLNSLKYPNAEQDYYDEMADMQSDAPTIPQKISLKIDDKMGIYRIDKPELRYPLGKGKKRMKLIKYLMSHEHASLKALMTATNQEKSAVISARDAINAMIIKKLDTSYIFILHLDVGGYAINKRDFEIKES